MRIFVAGSASAKIDPKYLEGIDEISKYLIDKKIGVVSVGTTVGSVGKVYNYFKENNGNYNIIVPKPYADEAAGMSAATTTVVDTLFQLQQLALIGTEATLVLPGGNGTLAELYMITDSIKSKFDTDAVIIYNCNGFYDKIKEMNDFMIESGVMEQFQYDFFTFCNTPKEVINELKKIKKK